MFNDRIIKAKEILTDSLQMVFISSIAVISIGLIASLALKELPLRQHQDGEFGGPSTPGDG